ncbi:MAG TPA: arylsulfatase [Opitutaceae bacterium]|nr:arylsulfatase [Opitutaceae bacterium]
MTVEFHDTPKIMTQLHSRLRTFAAGGILALLSATWLTAAQPAAAAPRPPNIVFIIADDLGYGDLGCYGQQRIKTPNIDRLAAQGMRFTQFYAGAPVCAPSRNALMTGQHAGHLTIRGNAKVDLRKEEVTVAQVLQRAGYATGLMGKWGLGREGSTAAPRRKGLDAFFGYVDQSMAHNYYPGFLIRNEETVPLRNVVPNPGPYGQGVATVKLDYSADLIADEAVKFVRENHQRPFCLFFTPTLPHANNEAGDDGMEVPDYGPYAKENWPSSAKGLAAMITRLDTQVGRLMAELKTLGLEENTLVIFTSDNGPHQEGGNNPQFFASAGPLRGIKRDLYEGGIRVPLIVSFPGRVKAATVSNQTGFLGDFMATLAEFAHASPPAGLDGISLVPTLTGRAAEQKQHEFFYWEFYEGKSAQAVRMGRWKAIRSPMHTGTIELYDLESDVGEKNDLAARHPEIVAQAGDAMKRAHVPSPDWKVVEAPVPATSPATAPQ